MVSSFLVYVNLYYFFIIFCRGDSRIARFTNDNRLLLRGVLDGHYPQQNNSLNEKGLGGACELAVAKAKFHFAPTVCL